MYRKKLTFTPLSDDRFLCKETGEVVNGLPMNGFVLLPLKKTTALEIRPIDYCWFGEIVSSPEVTELIFCNSFPCFSRLPQVEDKDLAQYFSSGKLQKTSDEWKKLKKYFDDLLDLL